MTKTSLEPPEEVWGVTVEEVWGVTVEEVWGIALVDVAAGLRKARYAFLERAPGSV